VNVDLSELSSEQHKALEEFEYLPQDRFTNLGDD
jgi:hypothetical protein